MDRLSNLHDELDEDEEMVPPAQIGAMLADWTDPAKTVYVCFLFSDSPVIAYLNEHAFSESLTRRSRTVPFISIWRLTSSKLSLRRRWRVSITTTTTNLLTALMVCTEDRKKVLAQLLGKLHIPDEADDDKVKQLKLLIANLRRVRSPQAPIFLPLWPLTELLEF